MSNEDQARHVSYSCVCLHTVNYYISVFINAEQIYFPKNCEI
jgi:hypothetical protein